MEQEEVEKLQRVRVHKKLEQDFDLGNLRTSDRTLTMLRQAGPEAELRPLARDNTRLPTVRWRWRW